MLEMTTPPPSVITASPHRATYILERGVWRATCRVCGWAVADPQRRIAAAQFRHHIQEFRGTRTLGELADDLVEEVIDLREPARMSPVAPAVHIHDTPSSVSGQSR